MAFKASFGGTPKPLAQLRLSKARSAWVEHKIWHPEQKSLRTYDDRFVLMVSYADERDLLVDILRCGAAVDVIEPARLGEQVHADDPEDQDLPIYT